MTEIDEINFEAESDSESIGLRNLLYPIIGSVISALCIIGIVVFIISRRRCRKRTPRDTESDILKKKLTHDKHKVAHTSLVYSMQGRPVYTSITQQEDNEIADEVRESYKEISPHVNKPIILCPNDKSSYSYYPKQEMEEHVEDIHKTEVERRNNPSTISSGKLTEENISKHNFLAPKGNDLHFDNDSLLSHQSSLHENTTPTNEQHFGHLSDVNDAGKDDNIVLLNQKHSPPGSFADTERSSRKEDIVSRWMSEEEERKSKDMSQDYGHVDNRLHTEHNSSMKTNFEANYEDVESILTSVSRMDKRRLDKLKETDFYRKLQYTEKPLNLSVESINVEDSLSGSVSTPIANQKCSLLHEQILSLRSREDESDEKSSYRENQHKEEIFSKRSLKKPLHYIDRDSESFFKTVRVSLNPDNFSESGRTFSEEFKKSRRDSEVSRITDSTLSVNSYSYDKESHDIIIDKQRKPQRKKEEKKYYGNSNDSISSSPSRPSTLSLENKNTSINFNKEMYCDDDSDEEFSHEELSPSTGCTQHSTSKSLGSTRSQLTNRSHFSNDGTNNFIKKTSLKASRPRINSFCGDTTSEILSDLSDTTNSTNDSISAVWTRQEQQNSDRSNHKSQTKYKSVRGNLSTYISSRQSATISKSTVKGFSHDTSKRPSIPPAKKLKQSPGRRIFQNNRGMNNQGKWRPQFASSSNGTL